jgi:hypothetical protein
MPECVELLDFLTTCWRLVLSMAFGQQDLKAAGFEAESHVSSRKRAMESMRLQAPSGDVAKVKILSAQTRTARWESPLCKVSQAGSPCLSLALLSECQSHVLSERWKSGSICSANFSGANGRLSWKSVSGILAKQSVKGSSAMRAAERLPVSRPLTRCSTLNSSSSACKMTVGVTCWPQKR